MRDNNQLSTPEERPPIYVDPTNYYYYYYCRSHIHENSVYDDNIQSFNDNVTEMVNKTANSSIPIKHWNDAIRRAIYDRNRARNKMSRANTPENIENYKRLKCVAQHVIKESAETHWHNFCNAMSSSTRLNSVWNMAKRMNGIQPNVACKHLNCDNGDTLEWNKDKAELLACKFAEGRAAVRL